MKTKRILQPGQPGTKKLLTRYGNNLICVRYRYDDEQHMVLKTIEIVVDRKPWNPRSKKIPNTQMICLKIEYDEIDTRNQVKAAGGKWDPKRRVWQLCYGKVIELGMVGRIVSDEGNNVSTHR